MSSHPWNTPAAVNGLIPAASVLPSGAYATRVNGLISGTAALNVAWQKDVLQQRDQLDVFIIDDIAMGAGGAGADNEILSSIPAGSASGIGVENVDAQFPSNFGRGWGNFKPGDENYIALSMQCDTLVTADVGAASVVIVDRAFVANAAPDSFHGNISIRIMNLGLEIDGPARAIIQFVRDEDR